LGVVEKTLGLSEGYFHVGDSRRNQLLISEMFVAYILLGSSPSSGGGGGGGTEVGICPSDFSTHKLFANHLMLNATYADRNRQVSRPSMISLSLLLMPSLRREFMGRFHCVRSREFTLVFVVQLCRHWWPRC
jgi:hypothetical protein